MQKKGDFILKRVGKRWKIFKHDGLKFVKANEETDALPQTGSLVAGKRV